MGSSLGREKETFLTRLGEISLLQLSSQDETDSVGVSGVQARELLMELDGEWQLEPRDDMDELDRTLLTTDSSAALMRADARLKWLRAC